MGCSDVARVRNSGDGGAPALGHVISQQPCPFIAAGTVT